MADFKSITPKTNFTFRDGFCDSQGNINQDLPRSNWNIDFTELNDSTTVDIDISHETLADLEQKIEIGFKEGLTATLEELAKVLTNKNK